MQASTNGSSMASRKASSYFIGQVIQRGIAQPDTLKIRTRKMVLDKYLTKYYNKNFDIWAQEKKFKVKLGDIVLLKELPRKPSPRISYEIHEMVFQLGETIDPVTGRRCIGTSFADIEVLEKMKHYYDDKSEKETFM